MPQREEESLIDEMRAAIRADRERAAQRAPKTPPAPVSAPEPQPQVDRPRFRRLLGRRD